MPRFYFHLYHGVQALPDPEGTECADHEVAIKQGVRTVLEMLTDDVRQGRVDLRWRMEIKDKSGRAVSAFSFAQVLGGTQLSPPLEPRLRQ